MPKLYFRRWRFLIFAATTLLALLSFAHQTERSLAQHRAERRPAEAKPKSRGKNPVTARSRTAQQQINADGSITGTLWYGEFGVTETTDAIMSRELSAKAAQAKLKHPIEREPEHEPDSHVLPGKPSLHGYDVAWYA